MKCPFCKIGCDIPEEETLKYGMYTSFGKRIAGDYAVTIVPPQLSPLRIARVAATPLGVPATNRKYDGH